MNLWQTLRQLKYLLGAQTWPDGTSESVFGTSGVYATAGPAEEAIGVVRFPYAIIKPLGSDVDDEHDDLITQNFEVIVACVNQSDFTGEHALIGGPRSAGQGSSAGRGLLELEEELLKSIGKLEQTSGISLRCDHSSAVDAALVEGFGYVATRSYNLEAVITRERYYHPAMRLAATASGGGNVALTWAVPPDRFDRREVILRRAAGATAPTSVTAGTGISLASLLATSVTDSSGAGQFSYALFAGYDEMGAGASDRYSASITVTVTAT